MSIKNFHNNGERVPKQLYRVDYKPFTDDEDGFVYIIARDQQEASKIFLSFYSQGCPNPEKIPNTPQKEVNQDVGEREISELEKMVIEKVSDVVLVDEK